MIGNISFHTVFIYLTEKCNLRCKYCYFRDKRARSLTFHTVEKFLHCFDFNKPKCFELSGGEPLLLWPLVKRIISYLKANFRQLDLGIQTNGLLLDDEKLSFIKRNKVMLEIGLDGSFQSTAAYRKGIDKTGFLSLIKNIKKSLKKQIDLSCTMTVHPQEASKIRENFKFIQSLGVKEIDVTPAAFMDWDYKSIKIFKQEYQFLMDDKNNRKDVFTEEDKEFIQNNLIDLSLHPPGYLFCGDAYLCLPEQIRNKYSLADFNQKDFFNKHLFNFYLKKYKKYLNQHTKNPTYRDYISVGFEIVNSLTNKNYLNTKVMIDFHNFLKKVHLQF